jgi:hypothetical protein
MNLSKQKLLCKATILFLQMCRKQAYANGAVDYGFRTHFLERYTLRIIDYIEMHQAINSMYGLEEEE